MENKKDDRQEGKWDGGFKKKWSREKKRHKIMVELMKEV